MRLSDILKAAGWNDADIPTAASVAMAESGGKVKAKNSHPCGTRKDGTPAYAVGILQICTIHLDPGGLLDGWTEADLENAVANARAGEIVKNAQGWGAWTTYTTGAYRRYPTAKNTDIAVPTDSGHSLSKIAQGALLGLPGIGPALGILGLGGVSGGPTLPDLPDPVGAVKDVAGAITGAVSTLTNPKTWFTLGKVYFGGALILIGVGGLVFVVAKTVVNSAPAQTAINAASAAGGPAGKALKTASGVVK